MKIFIQNLLCCVLACLTVVALADTEKAERPNILLIVAEDLSSRVGVFGDAVAQTPSIDALAAQGVRYTNVFTASGVCAPSRSALITGVYPQSMGTQHMRTSNLDYQAVPPPEVKAFPELLRRAGYATANTVKTDYQFGDPFTIWDVNHGNMSSAPDLALWRRLPADKPFFAMINLMSTHESRLATPATEGYGQFVNLIKNVTLSRAENVKTVTDPDDVTVPPYYPDTSRVRASIAQLYDNVHYMDGEVGQILANLKADGLADNTIVIWTTDHGDGLPRAKRAVYDSGIKVPLIIRFPDADLPGSELSENNITGEVRDQLVSFVDLAPTVLHLAGVDVPEFIQGQDFLNNAEREYIYAARDRMDKVPDRVRAVRDSRYKYIRNYLPELPYFRPLAFRDMFPVMQELWRAHEKETLTPIQKAYFTPRPGEELYDTATDPFETRNLAADPNYERTLARLRGALDNWLAAVGDKSSEPEKQMVAAMWPGFQQPLTAAPHIKLIQDESARYLELQSATPGASIGYRFPSDSNKHAWQLYSQPVDVTEAALLEVKAIRYGFAESKAITIEVDNVR